ncbi:MAG: hypothetical protein J2P17_23805 [Mycobacterium sp.]|nr:hypothetical protein [Mycobacterium sp.]
MAWLRWTTNVLACEKPRACCPVLGCTSRRRADPYQRRFPRVRHGSHWLAAQRSGHVAPASWPEGTLPVHMHLDVAVDDLPGWRRARNRAGRREEDDQSALDWWRVVRAPGGHIFCLSHHIQDYLPEALERR